ncbi:Hypothetical protein PHPALM_22 [Phytophthora palmivora]|uniref:Uncharacterized protein n=1 Tax=Phytophthora palmivora TaxID=4796 RepID=A0A2P4YVX3_9STRA|nr:Hypothetical protein PHPALM_22 [Phytophthora palmivora]
MTNISMYDSTTYVKITTGVNARRRLDPPLPLNYVGNIIFNALSTYTNSELQPSGVEDMISPRTLGKLARRVRKSILQCDNVYLRDAMNFLTEQYFRSPSWYQLRFRSRSHVHMDMYSAEFDGSHPWYASVLAYHVSMGLLWSPKRRGAGSMWVCSPNLLPWKMHKTMFAAMEYLHD